MAARLFHILGEMRYQTGGPCLLPALRKRRAEGRPCRVAWHQQSRLVEMRGHCCGHQSRLPLVLPLLSMQVRRSACPDRREQIEVEASVVANTSTSRLDSAVFRRPSRRCPPIIPGQGPEAPRQQCPAITTGNVMHTQVVDGNSASYTAPGKRRLSLFTPLDFPIFCTSTMLSY